MTISLLLSIGIFLIGLALGSFTSAAVYRLHTKEHKFIKGRSICPQCKMQLKVKDLIPLVSYFMLRGRCRYCQKEISYMYPTLELLFGGLLVAFFVKFPFFNEFLQFDGWNFLSFIIFAIYTFILLFTFFFDLHYLHVADEILLPGIFIGLLTSFLPGFPNLIDLLVGLLIGAGFFTIQYTLSRGKWVGAGDIRVGGFIGVILGWKLTILGLILSYIIGSVTSLILAIRRHQFRGIKIPFAPFLVTGTLLTIFFGQNILEWYMKFLGL